MLNRHHAQMSLRNLSVREMDDLLWKSNREKDGCMVKMIHDEAVNRSESHADFSSTYSYVYSTEEMDELHQVGHEAGKMLEDFVSRELWEIWNSG